MARIEASIVVRGGGNVLLPVSFPSEAITVDSSPVEVDFSVGNPLDRAVTIPGISVSVAGDAASKVSASLVLDALTIPAEGSVDNKLVIQPNEPLVEGDEVVIRLVGEE